MSQLVIDPQFVTQVLTDVVKHTVKTLINEDVESGAVLPTDVKTKQLFDVSGIMNIVDERCAIQFVLGFDQEAILYITNKVYGSEFNEINHSVQQSVGELTNMIYGQMRTRLNNAGYKLKMALPSIILGPQHHITSEGDFAINMKFNLKGKGFVILVKADIPGKDEKNK